MHGPGRFLVQRDKAATPGFALLEALVALTIISTAGLALVDVMRNAVRAGERTAELEAETFDMARLLSAYTLLTSEDLRQRLGPRRVGDYIVEVDGLSLSTFLITVRAPKAPDLITIIYQEASHDR
jgi:type II secretory pathway component PulJ